MTNIKGTFMYLYAYLDLEALDIVISNPDVLAVEGIGHFLDGVPGLCGSCLQEGADLKGGGIWNDISEVSLYLRTYLSHVQMHSLSTTL